MPDPDERMTIDELAQRAGTASSTVRLYQTRGLVAPPEKQGRVGYYGPRHLARLRLVAQLQEEGFSLASIASLVDAWEKGRSLEEVLGLEAQVTAAWGPEAPLYLRPEELAARFPGGGLSVELFQRTVALGLIDLEGDRVVVKNPRFLAIGAELAALGVPLDEVVEEYARLEEASAGIAARFTQLFERHLWAPFLGPGESGDAGAPAESGKPGDARDPGLPPEDIGHLIAVLQRLSTLAQGVVGLTLRTSLKQAAASFLTSQQDRLRQAGVWDELRPLARAAGLDLPR